MLIIYMFSSYKRSFNYLHRRGMPNADHFATVRRQKWRKQKGKVRIEAKRERERERDSNIKYKIEGVEPLS